MNRFIDYKPEMEEQGLFPASVQTADSSQESQGGLESIAIVSPQRMDHGTFEESQESVSIIATQLVGTQPVGTDESVSPPPLFSDSLEETPVKVKCTTPHVQDTQDSSVTLDTSGDSQESLVSVVSHHCSESIQSGSEGNCTPRKREHYHFKYRVPTSGADFEFSCDHVKVKVSFTFDPSVNVPIALGENGDSLDAGEQECQEPPPKLRRLAIADK